MYPENWPKCECGEPCMDGKATCGRIECMARQQQERRDVPPPPGAYAFTEDGRFISGDGYGGERM